MKGPSDPKGGLGPGNALRTESCGVKDYLDTRRTSVYFRPFRFLVTHKLYGCPFVESHYDADYQSSTEPPRESSPDLLSEEYTADSEDLL